jgi:uncharacterized membrane protein YgcG
MVEIVVAIYIAIPVVILLAGAVIHIRSRWFPTRRRRLRNIPGSSSGPVSVGDRLYFALHDFGSSWGSGGDCGGGSDGGGGGGD